MNARLDENQNPILLLVSANADWLQRLATLGATLPGKPMAVVACRDLASVPVLGEQACVLVVVYVRDGGQALPSLAAGHQGAVHWLIQSDSLQDREAAFARGFTELLPAGVGDIELGQRLRQVRAVGTVDLALGGLSRLSRALSQELAGPLHHLGMGQWAIQQELQTLKPLFQDLHKAWFESNQALLERLRLILSVINLSDSWEKLDQTLTAFRDDVSRLREIHAMLDLGTGLNDSRPERLSSAEIVQACISLLSASASSGIRFSNRLSRDQGQLQPASLFFSAMFFTFIRLLVSLAEKGNGRGSLEVFGRSPETGAEQLLIHVHPDHPGCLEAGPDLTIESALFARIGIGVQVNIQDFGLEVILQLPSSRSGVPHHA